VSPFCGIEIIRAFREVNDQRDACERKFPFDPKNPVKPPWCAEGDVFCSVYEGLSHFAIGRATRVGGRLFVDAHLELVYSGESSTWTDRILLEQAGGSWVIADIQYAGGESLLTQIRRGLDATAKYLSGEP
jgi:hypothetical protein